MRPEEVYRARVENVNVDQAYLFNPYGKTKSARRKVPLNSIALSIAKRRVEAAEGPYLFPHKNDKDQPMLKANNAHNKALKDSGIAKCRLYDLRHTWATRVAQAGVDVVTLASLLGHSKLVMVMRYVHPGEAHRIDAVKKVELANAAKEIAEVEKRQAEEKAKKVPTISPTLPENPANFSMKEIEGKSNPVN
jgi:integrase